MKINLTQGKTATVDRHIHKKIKGIKWFYSGGYAECVIHLGLGVWKKKYMHRFIMNPPEGMEVDHINGDGLDNRLENLRICTRSQNGKNRCLARNNVSGYHGVYFNNTEKRKKKWTATMRINGKKTTIGRFYTKVEAALAYNEAARKYHGEYATLNEVYTPSIDESPKTL